MNWKTKACIMKLCAALPHGNKLYRLGQKKYGRLDAKPMTRLPQSVEMVRWLREAGISIDGLRLFEVGTGHIPIVPIGFFLCGAKEILTVDLNRRMESNLIKASMRWIADNPDEVKSIYHGVVPENIFNERFKMLTMMKNDPVRFLKEANIVYQAPMNAACTGLQSQSVDCHFSVTTLEHIPPKDLLDIFTEARRILTKDGVALHFVDLSDHFQHQDRKIMRINFLKYKEAWWQFIAGNEFAYCNRLRVSDYKKLFRKNGFHILHEEVLMDEEALTCLQKKHFFIDQAYTSYELEDICSVSLRVLLRNCAE